MDGFQQQNQKVTPLSIAALRYKNQQDRLQSAQEGLANSKTAGGAIGYGIAGVIEARRTKREFESLTEAFRQQQAQEEAARQTLIASYPEEKRGIAATLPLEDLRKAGAEAIKPLSPIDQVKLENERLQGQKTRADIAKVNKELAGGVVDPEKKFKMTNDLRSDYLKGSKTFIDLRDGYERVVASAQDPSAAGDLSLIFGYMKTLDPSSTVREGEFANAQNSGSLPSRVIAQYNKVISGERLSPEQRNDFVTRAGKLYNQALKSQEKLAGQYSGIAQRNNLPVNDVIVDFSTTAQAPASNTSASGKVGNIGWRRK